MQMINSTYKENCVHIYTAFAFFRVNYIQTNKQKPNNTNGVCVRTSHSTIGVIGHEEAA